MDQEYISLAKEYLAQGLKKDYPCKVFDQLWYLMYLKQLDIMNLPLTLQPTCQGHIPRWWRLVKKFRSLLDNDEFSLNPTNYGWENIDRHVYE